MSLVLFGLCGGFNKNGAVVHGEHTQRCLIFPWGGQGAILSPMSAVVWSVFDGLLGPAWATTVTTWLMMVGTMLGMVYLGQSFRLNKVALGAMMLMCLLPRYIVFTLGETGVVGVAMIPLLIGLSLIVRLEEKDQYPVGLY